jgi:hypothetical protein
LGPGVRTSVSTTWKSSGTGMPEGRLARTTCLLITFLPIYKRLAKYSGLGSQRDVLVVFFDYLKNTGVPK